MGQHPHTGRPVLEWETRARGGRAPEPAYDVISVHSIGGRAHIGDDFSAGSSSGRKVLLFDVGSPGDVSIYRITI